jgi:hypothetical protein
MTGTFLYSYAKGTKTELSCMKQVINLSSFVNRETTKFLVYEEVFCKLRLVRYFQTEALKMYPFETSLPFVPSG